MRSESEIVELINNSKINLSNSISCQRLIDKGFNLVRNIRGNIKIDIIIHPELCIKGTMKNIDMISLYEDDNDLYNIIIMNYMIVEMQR